MFHFVRYHGNTVFSREGKSQLRVKKLITIWSFDPLWNYPILRAGGFSNLFSVFYILWLYLRLMQYQVEVILTEEVVQSPRLLYLKKIEMIKLIVPFIFCSYLVKGFDIDDSGE